MRTTEEDKTHTRCSASKEEETEAEEEEETTLGKEHKPHCVS
jgi:hypothetical protein